MPDNLPAQAASISLKRYVVGLMFTTGGEQVVLIQTRKDHPLRHLAGRLNGVGGKVEPGETPAEAMRREFREEACVDYSLWEEIIELSHLSNNAVIHFFRAFTDEALIARSGESQLILLRDAQEVKADGAIRAMKNLEWIIPICLATEIKPVLKITDLE